MENYLLIFIICTVCIREHVPDEEVLTRIKSLNSPNIYFSCERQKVKRSAVI